MTLVHGPGCPVCVTPLELIDRALAIARRPEVIFTSFGDMLRVPGSTTDLLSAKSEGADVRMVYSPLDAVKLATSRTPTAGGLLRRRLRDHRAAQRHGGHGRRSSSGVEQLLHPDCSHVLVPPGDGGDPC